jgi:hypothetical protein
MVPNCRLNSSYAGSIGIASWVRQWPATRAGTDAYSEY